MKNIRLGYLFISLLFVVLGAQAGVADFSSEENFISYVNEIFTQHRTELENDILGERPSQRRDQIFLIANCGPASKHMARLLNEKYNIEAKQALLGRDHLGRPTHAVVVASVLINNVMTKFVIDPTYRQYNNSLASTIANNRAHYRCLEDRSRLDIFDQKNDRGAELFEIFNHHLCDYSELAQYYQEENTDTVEENLNIPLVFVASIENSSQKQQELNRRVFEQYGDFALTPVRTFPQQGYLSYKKIFNNFMQKLFFDYRHFLQ